MVGRSKSLNVEEGKEVEAAGQREGEKKDFSRGLSLLSGRVAHREKRERRGKSGSGEPPASREGGSVRGKNSHEPKKTSPSSSIGRQGKFCEKRTASMEGGKSDRRESTGSKRFELGLARGGNHSKTYWPTRLRKNSQERRGSEQWSKEKRSRCHSTCESSWS